MTELLTESFCERCGTRYTFESQAPKRQRLTSIRTLSRGLRNYVLSDDTSLDEAMAAARNDDERAATSEQLEAFHQTFNFCMTCRQYTCANCWNEAEGRCLSCAPDLSREVLDAPFPNLVAHVRAAPTNGIADHAAEAVAAGAETDWPAIDVASRLGSLAPIEPEPEAKIEVEAIAVVEPDTDPLAAGSEDAVPAVEPGPMEAAAVEAPSEPKAERPIESTEARRRRAERQTAAVLAKFRPGLSLDEALAAYEASLADATTAMEPAAELEPVAVEPEPVPVAAEIAAEAVEPELEPIAVEPEPVPVAAAAESSAEAVEPEPEPVAAELEPVAVEPVAVEPVAAEIAAEAVEPKPEPVAAEPEPVAAAVEPEPEPVATDHIPQPTWPAAAPTPATTDDGHVAPPAGEPTWPTSPRWTDQASSEPPTWPGQPEAIENDRLAFLLARRSTEDLWAASNREVVTTPAPVGAPAVTVQNCISCGLSLSATARFCRRCGARQEA
jgi:hypothetical protein